MRVLVTGGAGYVGSHVCVELLASGAEVVVFDNFSNGHRAALLAAEAVTQRKLCSIEGDLRDRATVDAVLRDNSFDAVIHLAGSKNVRESVTQPLAYYDNNVTATLSLLAAMRASRTRKLIFSSSAAVYGMGQNLPISEDHPLQPTTPYGRSKQMIEQILKDLQQSEPAWRIGVLRYFNPVGAHQSGHLGEHPKGLPDNLLPVLAEVAADRLSHVPIWGDDYDTPDGTAIRDYVHVMDVARGHWLALQALVQQSVFTLNLATGRGHSVLEVVQAFEAVTEIPVAKRVETRRAGDAPRSVADPRGAERLLNWRARYDLATMCRDHWRWRQQHPEGYAR